MNVRDWRDVPASGLAPIYARAHDRWLHVLDWDTSSIWMTLEEARTTWGLPGLVAMDRAGRIRGWTFFLPEDNQLRVGGLAADTPRATRALVRGLIAECEASGAGEISCFMFDEAPLLASELTHAGFEREPFLYLSRNVAGMEAAAAGARAESWVPDDLAGVAALLRHAYGPEQGRHFAPGDGIAAWERYVTNLVEQTALGRFNPYATRIVRHGDCIDAVVLVTTVSPQNAHLAQVAVHAASRGAGLARRIIEEACAIAARQGHTRVTLLVGSSNLAARRLYERVGFTARARFVAARIDVQNTYP